MSGKRGGALPAPFEVRFWTKVDRTQTCWLWTGAVNDSGYGVILGPDSKHLVYAHRVAYEKLVGPVPEDKQLDHLCRVRRCVNPAHVEPVTHLENIQRGTRARTHCRRGHEYNPTNTYYYPSGRQCKLCAKRAA